jgi:hypothetical protein
LIFKTIENYDGIGILDQLDIDTLHDNDFINIQLDDCIDDKYLCLNLHGNLEN